MKAESLKQAIDFVLSAPKVKSYIQSMESLSNRFVIAEISTKVINYDKKIIRVFINFNEKGNPNNFKEDAIIDLQGTTLNDFKILNVNAYEVAP